MINAIIMASGKSKRMGNNKLLLPYKGKYLIEHTLDCVMNCSFKDIALVATDSTVLKLGDIRGMISIFNQDANNGQSESIKLGLKELPRAAGYAFFTGDQPLMDCETIQFLIDQFTEHPDSIIVPTFKQRRGMPTIFPARFKSVLLTLVGDSGGRSVIEQYLDVVLFVEVSHERFLMDIDTEEEYLFLVKED